MEVPSTTARMTAGMFSMSVMEEMPMPMAQTPRTEVSLVMKSWDNLWPNSMPKTPPTATAKTFVMMPINGRASCCKAY